MSQAVGLIRRFTARAGLLPLVLAVIEPTRSRQDGLPTTVEAIIGSRAESVLRTRTVPPGPRWIEVSRWEDLVKASDFMGKPILQLDDGTRGSDQPFFYIPDGPQSFVFDFRQAGLAAARSGAFLRAPTSNADRPSEELPSSATEAPTRIEASPAPSLDTTAKSSLPSDPPSPRSANAELVEKYLGPDVPDPVGPIGTSGSSDVERQIRGMIHDLLSKLREVPPSSDRLEKGTYHIERAIELLRFARYGQAQIELNRASRLIGEADVS